MSRDMALGHSGASQNVGNQLRPGMSSVKLHAPPGGASSLSLAWGAEPADPVGRSGGRRAVAASSAAPPAAPVASVYGPPAVVAAPYASGPSVYDAAPPASYAAPSIAGASSAFPPVSAAPARPSASGAVSSNAYASGANQNSGNFITDRPTTRVHAAPGGRSSIVLG